MSLLSHLREHGSELSKMERMSALGSKAPGGNSQLRVADPQGMFTPAFRGLQPRKMSPQFLEVLREAVPVIDAGIDRKIWLLGLVEFEGENAKLVDEITDWAANVAVNGVGIGLQSFFNNLANEVFEQGFNVCEYVMDKSGRDVVELVVADSKQIHFVKDAKGGYEMYYRPLPSASAYFTDPVGQVGQLIAGSWNAAGWFAGMGLNDIRLNPANKLYFSRANENQDPHGTSIMRSLPFVGKLVATIENTQLSVFERFGDPMYHIHYAAGAGRLATGELEKRQSEIRNDFNTVLAAKRAGQSGDLVTAAPGDGNVGIKVIGQDGQVIEMEVPMRHCLEMVCAKFGLAPWMLALHYSTTERLAEQEVDMMLMDAAIQKASYVPRLTELVRVMLRARGRTWKPGDWNLVLRSPHLHDIMKVAQANFLNAQAGMMRGGLQAGTTTSVALGAEPGKVEIKLIPLAAHKHAGAEKDASPEALRIREDYSNSLKDAWHEAMMNALKTLGLTKDAAPVSLTPEDYERVRQAVMKFVEEVTANTRDLQGPVVQFTGEAHALGFVQAAHALGKDAPLLDLQHNRSVFDRLLKDGFDLVKNNTTKAYEEDIKAAMQEAVEKGWSPKDLARVLRKAFTDKNTDWERLARSEVAMAQERGKLAEWQEWGIERVKFAPAPMACPVCRSLAGEYDIKEAPVPVQDTHPRCTCAITLA